MRLNKGFTIIELLIVIVIIGILVAITAVSYTGVTNGANTAQNQSNAKATKQALIACHAKNGVFPTLTNAGINDCGAGMTIPTNFTASATAPTASTTAVIGISGANNTTGAITVTYWDLSSGTSATL